MGGNGAVVCVNKIRNILIAVNRIQLRRGVGLIEDKRTCRDRFSRIPDEAVGRYCAARLPAVACYAEVVVVGEAVKAVGRASGGVFKIQAATSLVIKRHQDGRLVVGVGGIDARPPDRPVLAVILDAPGAGLGGD